jgi:hypothetical protein
MSAEKTNTIPKAAEGQTLSKETENLLTERPLEEDIPLEKKNRLLIYLGIVVSLVVLGSTVAVFYYSAHLLNQPIDVVTEIKTQVSEDQEESSDEIKTDITFEVLNGSGKSGVAAKAAAKLEALGYKVINIGNADNGTYQGNRLFLAKTITDSSTEIIKTIGTEFGITTSSGELKDSTASARIIVGK